VRDDRAEVDQDPAAVRVPLRTRDRKAVLTNGIRNGIGDRARLNFRAPGDDDERIGNDGPAVQIEDRDVLALLVFGGGADDVDEFRQSVSPGVAAVRSDRGRRGFARRA
jgi:hypothetical protein